MSHEARVDHEKFKFARDSIGRSEVAEADVRFTAAGTRTLSKVRQRYSKNYLQILKHRVIRSETEYYLVKGIANGGGIEPGATEAAQLQAMLNDFEVQLLKSSE